eukprot:EG_transcript_4849
MCSFATHCSLAHFCEHNGPKIEFTAQVIHRRCQTAADSVITDVQYRTTIPHFVFEGSHHLHPAWTPFLRSICIRCLSVEFLGGDARVMCFGDHSQGYTCFYVFKVPDVQARGGTRQLCLSLTNTAPEALLANFPLLAHHFAAIGAAIRARADAVLHRERRDEGAALSHAMTLNSFRTQRSTRQLRDFPLLLEVKDFYPLLHRRLSWLLWCFTTSRVFIPPPPVRPIAGAEPPTPPHSAANGPTNGLQAPGPAMYPHYDLAMSVGPSYSEAGTVCASVQSSASLDFALGSPQGPGGMDFSAGTPLSVRCGSGWDAFTPPGPSHLLPDLESSDRSDSRLRSLGEFTVVLLRYYERQYEKVLRLLRAVLWYVIAGQQVVVHSNAAAVADDVVRLFARVLPAAHQPLVRVGLDEYVPPSVSRLMSLSGKPSAVGSLQYWGLTPGSATSHDTRSLVLYLEVEEYETPGTLPRLRRATMQEFGPEGLACPASPVLSPLLSPVGKSNPAAPNRTTLGEMLERLCFNRYPPPLEQALLDTYVTQWHALSFMFLQCAGPGKPARPPINPNSWFPSKAKNPAQEFLTRSRLRKQDLPVLQFLAARIEPAPLPTVTNLEDLGLLITPSPTNEAFAGNANPLAHPDPG